MLWLWSGDSGAAILHFNHQKSFQSQGKEGPSKYSGGLKWNKVRIASLPAGGIKALVVEQISNVNYSQHQTSAAINYTNRGIITSLNFFPLSFGPLWSFSISIRWQTTELPFIHSFIHSACLVAAYHVQRAMRGTRKRPWVSICKEKNKKSTALRWAKVEHTQLTVTYEQAPGQNPPALWGGFNWHSAAMW